MQVLVEKSELAKELFETINSYSNLIKIGFVSEPEEVDFSFLDRIEIVQVHETQIQKNPFTQETNNFVPEPRVTDASAVNKKRKIIDIAQEIMKCSNCILNCKKKVSGIGSSNSCIEFSTRKSISSRCTIVSPQV